MFKFQIDAEDWLSLVTGLGSNDVQVPQRTIPRADFPDAPVDVVDQPVLFPYGNLWSTSSATAPPTLTGTASRGAHIVDGQRVNGFGNNTSSATPPTSITATAASGGTLSADVPNAEYGVIVTALDGSGNESDPYPFYVNVSGSGRGSFPSFMPKDTVSGTQRLNVSWSGATGASSYNVYIGYYYFGWHPTQKINTASTSCTFTAGASWTVAPSPSNITPGATLVTFSQFWWYAVSAVMGDGETGISQQTEIVWLGFSRPFRIEWLEVPSATGYRVYKRGPGGVLNFIYRFDVSGGSTTFFDDDLTNAGATTITGLPQKTGYLPARYVGQRADIGGFKWHAFLIAGCAIKEIVNVFQNGAPINAGTYGVTFAVPGKTSFSSFFGATTYVDINDRRYTLMYVRGAAADSAINGAQPLTVSIKGIEATGDGTGTLLTSIYDQYRHFLRNVALRNYQTGNWEVSGPTWGDVPNDVDVVNTQSFELAKAIAAVRLPSGYQGAFVVGLSETGDFERATVRAWVSRLSLSADVYSGFSRKSQFILAMLNDDVTVLDTATPYTATLNINEGTFQIADKVDMMENQINYSYGLNPAQGGYASTASVEDTAVQAAIGETRPYDLKLFCIPDLATASDIATRRLDRRKVPYRTAQFETDMGSLTTDLGDVVLVTHPDGYGPNGYEARPHFVTRHEFDTDGYVTLLQMLDIAYLYGSP